MMPELFNEMISRSVKLIGHKPHKEPHESLLSTHFQGILYVKDGLQQTDKSTTVSLWCIHRGMSMLTLFLGSV